LNLFLKALPTAFFLALLYLPVTALETGIEYIWFLVVSAFLWLVALPRGLDYAVPVAAGLILIWYALHRYSLRKREVRNAEPNKTNEELRVKSEMAVKSSSGAVSSPRIGKSSSRSTPLASRSASTHGFPSAGSPRRLGKPSRRRSAGVLLAYRQRSELGAVDIII
jgi:hypothetical protein